MTFWNSKPNKYTHKTINDILVTKICTILKYTMHFNNKNEKSHNLTVNIKNILCN